MPEKLQSPWSTLKLEKALKKGALLFFLLIGLFYNFSNFSKYPSQIHAWAQADRYALSLGFVENDLNFFKPQTLIYNHQFPGNWNTAREHSITAVDFPIHDFIPAVVMKVSGSTSPLIFRLYIFLFSLAALYYLFQLASLITGSYFKSFLVCVFAATSPVFVYYQANFLPSIPCLASVIIGLYYYLKYMKLNLPKYLGVSILFFTLAALSRSTYAIPLIALICAEVLRMWRYGFKPQLRHSLFFVSLAIILVYQLYNSSLRASYGSDFLNYLLPPRSFGHAMELLKRTIQHWGFQYFTIYHYLVLVAVILVALLFVKRSHLGGPVKWIILYTGILTVGYTFFCIMMLRQFPDHDYYFLDTFFLPFLLLLIFLLAIIPEPLSMVRKYFTGVSILLIMSFMFYQPVKSQKERYSQVFWNKTHATLENFKHASAFLDAAGIPSNARMLVIDAVAPNLPFVLMQRTGYAVMFPTKENITNSLNWKFDYIVLQDEYLFNELNYTFPDLVKRLQWIAGNGKISLYTLTKQQKVNPFSQIKKRAGRPVISYMTDFEKNASLEWTNLNYNDSVVYSGSKAGYLPSGAEFGLTFTTTNLPLLLKKRADVFIKFQYMSYTTQGCLLVAKINSGAQRIYYREFDLQELPFKDKEWQTVELMFKLPKVEVSNFELSIYFWNPSKSEIYYDDFMVEVY